MDAGGNQDCGTLRCGPALERSSRARPRRAREGPIGGSPHCSARADPCDAEPTPEPHPPIAIGHSHTSNQPPATPAEQGQFLCQIALSPAV